MFKRKCLVVILLSVLVISCAELRDMLVQQSVNNLSKCKFRLVGVEKFSLAGVPLSGVSSLSQLSIQQGLNLTRAFAQGNLPTAFTLNVGVQNPNDGSNGMAKAAGVLSALPWSLYIDEKPTVRGALAKSFALPSGSQETVIPLDMNLNLAEFFKDQGYKNILNLALALGGANASPSRLRLRGQPTIDTPMGPIQYPNEIDIVDRQM